MSWSIGLIGKASNINTALTEYSAALKDEQIKKEFDDALPILTGLVAQNFKNDDDEPVLTLTASGSGYSINGEQKSRSLTVKLEPTWTKIV